MSHLRHVVLAGALTIVGCLTPPDPENADPVPDTGPMVDDGDDAERPQGDMTSPRPDASPEVVCEPCTLEALQCITDDAGRPVLQVCRSHEGAEAGCNGWVESMTCVGDQVCDTMQGGCICEGETCALGDPLPCPAAGEEGVVVCVMINDCPRPIDIGRAAGCAAIPQPDLPACSDEADYPWCGECADGRSCEAVCGNDRGFTCGLVNTIGN